IRATAGRHRPLPDHVSVGRRPGAASTRMTSGGTGLTLTWAFANASRAYFPAGTAGAAMTTCRLHRGHRRPRRRSRPILRGPRRSVATRDFAGPRTVFGLSLGRLPYRWTPLAPGSGGR